ncbi:hypothetical protein [Geodermatophilus africanus]|uniref:hypothetical protein n=1 Tax=Geodermatophilus africanus TaxID=1137993 RepID=UPI001114B84A|nr:hypothetical protein [Geodermatophilus africanus]
MSSGYNSSRCDASIAGQMPKLGSDHGGNRSSRAVLPAELAVLAEHPLIRFERTAILSTTLSA